MSCNQSDTPRTSSPVSTTSSDSFTPSELEQWNCSNPPPATLLCSSCSNITFRQLKTISPADWRAYFPFLDNRPELEERSKQRYESFIKQIPDGNVFGAILNLDRNSLWENAAARSCRFCFLIDRLLDRHCYIGRLNKPEEEQGDGIILYPPPSSWPEEDVDELRGSSPAAWLQLTVDSHNWTITDFQKSLENAFMSVKLANTWPLWFLLDDVQLDCEVVETNDAGNKLSDSDLNSYPDSDSDSDEHTGSVANLRLAKKWYDKCQAEHRTCALHTTSKTNLPTRLLDLEVAGLEQHLALCLPGSITNEGSPTYEYATLSHRWGDEQPLTTTTNNLEQHLICIHFSMLPKTFQDAVIFTRKMGIRYLWIDSLCIIQDSLKDKEHEIPKMVEIYSNAVFNIAAGSAENSDEGLFSKRITGLVQPTSLKLAFRLPNGESCTARTTLSLLLGENRKSKFKPRENTLEKRGWIFQERTFSKRLFSFDSQLLWFECEEMIASENLPRGGLRMVGDPKIQNKWNELLPTIGNRGLSSIRNHLNQALRLKDTKGTHRRYRVES
jgi:hypothetical protein